MSEFLDLDKNLLARTMNLFPDKTEKEIIEMGFKQLIVKGNRELARLFGSQKNLASPRRVPG